MIQDTQDNEQPQCTYHTSTGNLSCIKPVSNLTYLYQYDRWHQSIPDDVVPHRKAIVDPLT